MSHGHGHGHDHAAQAGADRGRLGVALAITLVIVVAQLVGSLVTGSLALLVDTAHLLVDASGLVLALSAAHLSLRPPNPRRTWGLRRAEVLAALAQAALLLGVGVFVLVEAVQRISTPPEIPGTELLVFGLVGLVGNLAALAVLASRRDASLNLRAAFLEVLNDALGSLAVVAAAVVLMTTGWQGADTVAALLVGALILPRALRLLRDAAAVLLESTPPGLDLADVRTHLLRVEHVREIHDVHASLIATGLPQLSAHVVVESACFTDGHAGRILDELQECVAEHFGIEHTTFQVEPESHPEHERPTHV